MCDQLRHDYLSCSGHPTIGTSNIDAFARRGVRFDRAFVQSPVCGPSRMSFYTGRYVASHGATWNGVPLRVGEPTAGDWLRPLGLEVALCGKTHMRPDLAGLERLAIESASDTARRHRECGFDAFIRDDGLHPDQHLDPSLAYNEWLRGQGYAGANPWHEFANSAEGPDGEVLSGWLLRHSRLPARVAEPDSETAWMTDRAISFMESRGDRPFLLHLSYIKPHWPYIAPAPYHAMFGPNHILPRVASPREALLRLETLIGLGGGNLPPKAMRQQMHLHSRKGKSWRWSRTMWRPHWPMPSKRARALSVLPKSNLGARPWAVCAHPTAT
jgi:arylsulfatase A-like enzyme